MDITVDFNVLSLTFQCRACGRSLDATEERGAIMLDPCQICTDEAYNGGTNAGHDEGYGEGYAEGHDEGYAEGKKDGPDKAKADSEAESE